MSEDLQSFLQGSPLFKSVFDNATTNAIQIMDTDGYILFVNEAFTKSFGYTSEDLQGNHCKVLFTKEDRAAQMPEMEIEKVNEYGFATDKNYTISKDGTCFWVSGESILAKNNEGATYIIKFLQNIHEQKLLEKFLKESKEFSESVVTSITDGLIVFDLNYRILKANNAVYSLLNINNKSLEGLHLFKVKNSFFSSAKLKHTIDEIIETGTATPFQIELTNETGASKHFSVKPGFIDGKLVNKRIVLVITDVTEKISSEQQRDDLLGFVIHELRNPLANITLCNSLLEQAIEENDKEEAGEFLEKIKTNTQRIKSLIQELYDATQAGSGNLNYNKTLFPFDDLVNEVIGSIQLINKSHQITKTGAVNVQVNADRERISQALNNYILNAIKYSPNANKVDVQLAIEDGSVVVAIRDYGHGIAESKIPHLFERYFRAEDSKKIEGLGLGLYLTKQIIDAHNGRVWVKSKEGEGSVFYFSIPKE